MHVLHMKVKRNKNSKMTKSVASEDAKFYALIDILKKRALSCGAKSSNRNVFKSNKHKAIIVRRHPALRYNVILGNEYQQKAAELNARKISLKDWAKFLGEFFKKYPGRIDRAKHDFKLFIYLESHNFCVDISENDVRTKIVALPMPDKVTGGPNDHLAVSFEHAINSQIMKYISQTQTNIEVLTKL